RAALAWGGASAIATAEDAALDRLARALADTLRARRDEALARAALGSPAAPLAEAERAEIAAHGEHASVTLELEQAERELATIDQARALVSIDDPERVEGEARARVEAAREAHATALAASARARQALEGAERLEHAAAER